MSIRRKGLTRKPGRRAPLWLAAGLIALLAAFISPAVSPARAQTTETGAARHFDPTPPLGQGAADLLRNGAFERTVMTFDNPDPKDGLVPDDLPAGWISWQSFTGFGSEMSLLEQVADNGPSRPGNTALRVVRTEGGGSGDQTMIRQDLDVPARPCSRLVLNVDTKVISHDLQAGGTVTPAFEWPASVEVKYRTRSGATQLWRYGWYVDPPGEGSRVNDPGHDLIPTFRDEAVTPGEWNHNSFDLLAELPDLDTLEWVLVGGAGWNFEAVVDNVELLCEPRSMHLADRRFAVEVDWTTPAGETGVGTPLQLTGDSGYVWFFRRANIELVVKVIDACVAPFERFWVFAAGLTNVGVTLRVTDTWTGETWTYDNPPRQTFQTILDTDAFATCASPAPAATCVDFDGLPVGTVSGAPAGNVPGQQVYTEDGVRVWVDRFLIPGFGHAFESATVQAVPAGSPIGAGEWLAVNNLNLGFDFRALPFLPGEVSFEFEDWGGIENLSVNGMPLALYAGELLACPSPFYGYPWTFTNLGGPASNPSGRITLRGAITTLEVGGQEMHLDRVCVRP